jgi:segregation and condensation protein B
MSVRRNHCSCDGLRKPYALESCFPASGFAWRVQQRRATFRFEESVRPETELQRGRGAAGDGEGITPDDGRDANPESKLRVVEAILMIAKEPLSARKLAVLAELTDPTQARTLARRLNEQYDALGHAFRIEEVAGGMQFLTRPQFAPWLRRLEHVPGEELLSQGMLETLAVVAYRQPLQRVEIEAIRGVSCDEVLRQLMQRDLVRITGRQEELGRPYLYGTTRRFLQLFGLQSLDSLPRAQKIRQAEAEIATRLAGKRESVQDIVPANEPNEPDTHLANH